MKSVLVALFFVLLCVVYEIDRDTRLQAAWESRAAAGRVLGTPPEEQRARLLPGPHAADAPGIPTGRVEREKSIRLFGPGVSRREQIRV